MTLKLEGTLLLAGAGRMGGALLSGWLAKGLDGTRIIVQDPAPSPQLLALQDEVAITITGAGADLPAPLPRPPQVIVMAVKPQVMDDVFAPLAKSAGPDTLILSIAAGRSIASFEKHLPAGVAVVRAMPNTPAAIGRGITVCCANDAATPAQRALCDELLSAVGEVGWVADEALIDPVTALSGSGPAYVFLLAECLADAGRAEGLDDELAMRLARATISGAGEMLRRSDEAAAALRENVTSPGGTTAAALEVLMAKPGLRELMKKAVAAATNRGRELGS